MQKTTKLGTLLTAVGAAGAVGTVYVAEHGPAPLAVLAGLLSGAYLALGVTALVIGWAMRSPSGKS